MRITSETLHKVARDTAEKYARRDRGLICIYLTGSLLTDNPLLGGTTDIDLIFVHTTQPAYPREIVRLTDEVHLDIANVSQTLFQQPRRLRFDPWFGSFLCANPLALHDLGHWFEFTQASAGAQFDMPEYIVQRARKLADLARQGWFDLQGQPPDGSPRQVHQYLTVLENAANSIALLSGTPLTERRFLLHFPARAEAVGRPGLAAGLVDLIRTDQVNAQNLPNWLEPWRESLLAAGALPDVPPRLAPARMAYYDRAATALNDDYPDAALWLVLRTWTRAVLALKDDSVLRQPWLEACRQCALAAENLEERHAELDVYLDTVEETLDEWAKNYGV